MTLRTIPPEVSGQYLAKAAGTLPNGSPVIVNSDGTVSAVVESVIPQTIGSATTFESASSLGIAAAYDTLNDKVVVVYRDGGNTSYLTAVVGTVSGTSISFGTPVVVASVEQYDTPAVSFDAVAGKFVIAYTNASYYGAAIVGTVSGTSITFGASSVFDTTIFILESVSCVFDSIANKTVIAYRGASGYGKAVVATISGTSVSFGAIATFESASIDKTAMAFSTVSGKIAIVYTDQGNSNSATAVVGTVSGTSISFGTPVVITSLTSSFYAVAYDSSNEKIVVACNVGGTPQGTAFVGTISGTSISFGSPVVYEAGTSNYNSVIFNQDAGKVVVSYTDVANSSYGTFSVGTVSGDTISFSTPVVFVSDGATLISSVFDPDTGGIVVAYRAGSTNFGNAQVVQITYSATNITAENYIGLSSGGTVASGSTARVDIVGAESTSQSGLTIGQQYYVQSDGSLGTTPDTPSVLAGTATSATTILVKA